MFRVEFIGLPGSGKTTIRRSLVREMQKTTPQKCLLTLEEAFLNVATRKMDRIYRFFLKVLPVRYALEMSNALMNRSLMQFEAQNIFLAKNGRALEAFFASGVFGGMCVKDRGYLIASFLETGALLECVESCFSDDTIVFFEEGLVQKSFMFISRSFECRESLSNLYTYLEHIPLPDIVLFIQADLDICCNRMMSRPKGMIDRLKGADRDTVVKFMSVAESHLQQVAYWFRQEHNDRLIIVENESEIQDVVMKLSEKLKRFI